MNALLKRDFYMSMANFLMIAITLPLFYLLKMSPHFMYLVIMYSFAWGLAYYDDHAKIHAFLASLPLKRKQIVQARYLFIIICGFVVGVFCLLLDRIFRLFFQYDVIAFNGKSFFVLFCVGLLLISFSLPFFYQFRFTISIILQIILLVVLVTVGIYSLRFIYERELTWLIEIAEWIYAHYQVSLSITMVLFLILSYFLSVRIFHKKDLP